jgi:hypothetical protein
LVALIPRHPRERHTVREALVERRWITDITGVMSALALYLGVDPIVQCLALMEADKLVWRWTTDGQYTSKSCYNALFEGTLISSSWRLNWKSWLPQG